MGDDSALRNTNESPGKPSSGVKDGRAMADPELLARAKRGGPNWIFRAELVFGVGAPLLVLLALTAWFRWTDTDLAICSMFYSAELNDWPHASQQPWIFLYRYGCIPGLAIGVAGLIVGLAGAVFPRWRAYVPAGCFLAGALALGPGLIINGIGKPHWQRPRPRQIVRFGGDLNFVRVCSWGLTEDAKSFPSGHASMGFYLIAPAFLLRRRHRKLAWGFLLIGVLAGLFIGVARIAQGGHFPSDVVWSGGVVYFSALLLYGLLVARNPHASSGGGYRSTLRGNAAEPGGEPTGAEPTAAGIEAGQRQAA
jgi:membrane-associated PAP2 superfamily phosphatase